MSQKDAILPASRMATHETHSTDARAVVRASTAPGRTVTASFFQEPETFDVLGARLSNRLRENRARGERFRVWVPCCGLGEEAFSVAMMLLEMLDEDESPEASDIQVFATDPHEDAVQLARAGIYDESIAEDVPPARLARFFGRNADRFHVRRTVRQVCLFARHDLLADPPLARMDLIVYRNRFSSLNPDARARVLWMLHYSLAPGGVLALGRSEQIEAADRRFTPMPGAPGLYQRMGSSTRWFSPPPAAAEFRPPRLAPKTPVPPQLTSRSTHKLRAGVDSPLRALLQEQSLMIEALRVANAEIANSNEELQTTNEELMTVREELHATNQELSLLNQELQHRNGTLADESADLAGLVRSLNLPIVTVDSHLRVRSFTRPAERWFGFAAGDVGRPIGDFRPKPEIPELEPLLQDTIENLTSHERDCTGASGRQRLSIRPYRGEDGRIDGAILMLWPLNS